MKEARWRPLGPKNCGGRIEAVDSPRGKPGVIYAGVGSGGVWKSVNGGLSWRHVFANESTFAVGDVTVDPSDGDVVWVGTGEAHLGGMSYDGTGVFRSGDGGETWRNMGLVDSARIGKVLVHPSDSNLIHVAVIGPRGGAHEGRGVHVSRDGGESWERTLHAGPHVGIIDLVRDPFDPDRLWAAGWDRRRQGEGGVFRSTDGGVSWTRLEGGLLQGKDVGRVAVAASASERGVVYALMVDHSPPGNGRYDVGGALFRSDDGGDTWARTSEAYVDTYVGWDFCDVMVSPDDADQVYVCGFRLMVSSDGGATFKRGGEEVFRLQEHPGKGMHLDMHDLWIDPGNPDRILLGTDGGLYVSMDRAESWLHLNNLPIAEFYTVHLDGAEPFRLWGGTQDNASLSAPSSASPLRTCAPTTGATSTSTPGTAATASRPSPIRRGTAPSTTSTRTATCAASGPARPCAGAGTLAAASRRGQPRVSRACASSGTRPCSPRSTPKASSTAPRSTSTGPRIEATRGPSSARTSREAGGRSRFWSNLPWTRSASPPAVTEAGCPCPPTAARPGPPPATACPGDPSRA